MADENTLRVEVGDEIPATDALRRFMSIPRDVGNVVTHRFFGRLVDEVGSVEAALEWLVSLAIEFDRPIAVNLPHEGASTSTILAPPTWTAQRLRDWVTRRRGFLESEFGTIGAFTSGSQSAAERPLFVARLIPGVNHPPLDEALTRFWNAASAEQKSATVIDCEIRGPLNAPRRRQLNRLVNMASAAGATLTCLVDLPEDPDRRRTDLAFGYNVAVRAGGGFEAAGNRMEIVLPRPPGNDLADVFEDEGVSTPTREQIDETLRISLPIRRVIGITDAHSIGTERPTPVVWLDASQRPDIADLPRVHQFEAGGGDSEIRWGLFTGLEDHQLVLIAEFVRPVRTEFVDTFQPSEAS